MTSNTMLYSLLSRVEALEKALLDPPGECAPGFDPDDPIIITKNGKPIAAVVSLDDAVLVEWAKDRYYNELAAAKASEELRMPFDVIAATVGPLA